MSKTMKKTISFALTLAICLSLSVSLAWAPAAAQADEGFRTLRQMEKLTRGLVAARLPGTQGVFMSWRFLGDEPDGISWNVYRSNDAGQTWDLIATIEPRDVEPESNFATNPGIVKENVTPSNYTDAAGTAASIYEVAPVIDGVEGLRQGMSVPMMTANTAGTGATLNVPYKTTGFGTFNAPQFRHRTTAHGPTNGTLAVIPRTAAAGATADSEFLRLGGETNSYWAARDTIHFIVDMDLLRSIREPFDKGAAVTQTLVNDSLAKLNKYLTLLNREPVPQVAALDADGKITEEFFNWFEAKFMEYVDWLDVGPKLPYVYNAAGTAITTSALLTNTSAYAPLDLTVGDFDGCGEYEIVALMTSGGGSGADPYQNCTGVGGNSIVAPCFVDVYKLDGTLLFRVDCGPNVMLNNHHQPMMFVQDFDNDGKAELIMKLANGAQVGNLLDPNNRLSAVVYSGDPATVVGGEEGLKSTREAISGYAARGDAESLDKYWNMVNGWSIALHRPDRSTAELSAADINSGVQKWMKTYHVGYNAGNVPETITAFAYDNETRQGYIVDSAPAGVTSYHNVNDPFYAKFGPEDPYYVRGNTDSHWGANPCDARGAYAYAALIWNTAGTSLIKNPTWRGFNRPNMHPKEVYWLENPWGYYPFGDAQGNRSSRFHGATAMLDGENWYACVGRGYYHRTTFAASRLVDGQLKIVEFDSTDPVNWVLQAPNCLSPDTCASKDVVWEEGGLVDRAGEYCKHCNWYLYQNRGNHQSASGDADFCGQDEIIMTGMTLTLNKAGDKLLPKTIAGGIMPSISYYNEPGPGYAPTTGPTSTGLLMTNAIQTDPRNGWWPLRHGDRGVLLAVDATGTIGYWSSGEENFCEMLFSGAVHAVMPASRLWSPATGAMIEGVFRAGGDDWDSGNGGNFTNRYPGIQVSTPGTQALSVSTTHSQLITFPSISGGPIWWDGDLVHENASGGTVNKIMGTPVGNATAWTSIYSGGGTGGNKGTNKLQLDMWGDWREEFIQTSGGNFVIHTSLNRTNYGIRTLMHDPFYRQAVANKHVSYDQPPAAGFYLGDEAPLPAKRTDIRLGAVDKTALEELCQFIADQDLNWEDYTAASWLEFCDAFAYALIVLEETNVFQYEVDEAEAALRAAYEALAPKEFLYAAPSAWVNKLNGNKNELYIEVCEYYCNGTVHVISQMFMIDNNAEGFYQVGPYKVFVNTKGNVQIREIYIAE